MPNHEHPNSPNNQKFEAPQPNPKLQLVDDSIIKSNDGVDLLNKTLREAEEMLKEPWPGMDTSKPLTEEDQRRFNELLERLDFKATIRRNNRENNPNK